MTDITTGIDALRDQLGADRVVEQKNISPYLTLRTQVTAEYFVEARSREDWKTIISLVHHHQIPYFIMGGGSNLAVLSHTVSGLVIRNMYSKKEVLNETEDYVDLLVSSGYSISRLAKETAQAGWSGLEYQFGLPGSVGGAVVMNSKWTNPDSYVGDTVQNATLITSSGEMKTVDREYFAFRYGFSRLQETKEFLLDVTFRLTKADPAVLLERNSFAVEYRNKTQPKGMPTSGCFFKNISVEEQARIDVPTRSAGYLIDSAGLKNTRIGDFVISDVHANFILNTGAGTPQDLQKMVDLIKQKVKEKYDIELREEVLIL